MAPQPLPEHHNDWDLTSLILLVPSQKSELYRRFPHHFPIKLTTKPYVFCLLNLFTVPPSHDLSWGLSHLLMWSHQSTQLLDFTSNTSPPIHLLMAAYKVDVLKHKFHHIIPRLKTFWWVTITESKKGSGFSLKCSLSSNSSAHSSTKWLWYPRHHAFSGVHAFAHVAALGWNTPSSLCPPPKLVQELASKRHLLTPSPG